MGGTVVVGVDGSEASKAGLGWAARQAELTDADLVAVYCWGPIYPVGVEPEETARQELMKLLVQVLGADRAATVRLVLSPNAPGHQLVLVAGGADLLVVGNNGHAALTGALLGSVSEYCVHHAMCPVVVVRAGEHV
jgi:nucleotide-binding universal stress UspA family protein